jgi:dTDP-4-dehydrorhamnose 3,5-epimerase
VNFVETKLSGVYQIDIEPHCDERGFFARTWCHKEFEEHGLSGKTAQCSTSFNSQKGTLRGIHFQAEPHPETKLVRCTRGKIFDVAVDLRPDSPTFGQWTGVVLSAENRKMLYIPAGCGHGLLTLEDRSEVFYMISEDYYPALSKGVRWNDPAFAIEWPERPVVISDRDNTYPDFRNHQL